MHKSSLNIGLLIFRLTLGGLMLFHGYDKIVGGVGGIGGLLASKGIPSFVAYGVLLGELVAPLLIVLGYRTRLAALVMSLTMLVAFLLVHTDDFFALGKNGQWALEVLAFFFLGGLGLFFTGGGKLALSSKNKWD